MSASVLETFWIMFASNSDEVESGAEKAGKKTDDLERKIKSTDAATNKLGNSFINLARDIAGPLAALVSFGAITAGLVNAVRYADMLDETSEALDISVETLDAWGNAAKLNGGSIEGFIGSVKTLNAAMTQLDVTGKSRVQPFFKELGIRMTDAAGKAREPIEIFEDLAGKFEKMDKQQAIGYGRKLGIDDGTIMLLQKGRRAVEDIIKRQKELGVVSAEDAAIAAKFNDTIDDTAHVFRVLFSELAGSTLPILGKALEAFQKFGVWIREHKEIILGFFVTVGSVLAGFAAEALIAAIAAGAISVPFLVIAAAVAALGVAIGLVYEDLVKFEQGGKSITGNIVNYFKAMGEDIIWVWEKVRDAILGVFEAISNAWANVTSKFKVAQANAGDLIINGVTQLNQAANTPIGAQTSNSISSSRVEASKNTTVHVGEVNVQTQATDAEGMAQGAANGLKTQIRQVTSSMDDGIKG